MPRPSASSRVWADRASRGPVFRLAVVLTAIISAASTGCSDRARHPFFDRVAADLGPGPVVFAHRGGGGIAPEATLPTLLAAHQTFRMIVEFDVHRSRDGQLVVIHDDTVDRTTDGHGAVADLDLAQLQRLDAGFCSTPGEGDGTDARGDCHDPAQAARFPFRGKGYRIPTLDEVLAVMPAAAFLGVEAKAGGFEAQLAATLRASGRLDHLAVGSEFDDISVRLKDLLPELPHYMPTSAARCFALAAKASYGYPCPEYEIFASPLRGAGLALDTAGVLTAAHRRGMVVIYWTINDEPTLDRLFQLGADGVFSDHPDRARRALDRFGAGPR
jgi:glycerophosphoryl diester phosphodiesterase